MSGAPLCRYCGKPIQKSTKVVYFGEQTERRNSWSTHLTAPYPATRAEAQKLVNEQIVAVRKGYGESEGLISHVHTWDGESYRDAHFCNADHARRFAYAVVNMKDNQLAMPDYWAAMNARESEGKQGQGGGQ